MPRPKTTRTTPPPAASAGQRDGDQDAARPQGEGARGEGVGRPSRRPVLRKVEEVVQQEAAEAQQARGAGREADARRCRAEAESGRTGDHDHHEDPGESQALEDQ